MNNEDYYSGFEDDDEDFDIDPKDGAIVTPEEFLKFIGNIESDKKSAQNLPTRVSQSQAHAMGVYLAGPIEKELFLTNPHSLVWRQEATALFEARDEMWDIKDPCEGKWQFNESEQMVYVRNDLNQFHYNSYRIFTKDIADLASSDIFLGNFSQMFSFSVGTLFELGFAYAQRIPIVLIASASQVEHPFLKESADIVVSTVTEAVDACIYLREQLTTQTHAIKSF